MKGRALRRAALGALVAFGGCARYAVGEVDPDAARVEAVRARFSPGDRGDVEIDFSAQSPFRGPCLASEVRWEVWLGNRWFAAGALALEEPVPEEGRRTFTVSLPVVFRRAGGEAAAPRSLDVGVRGFLVLTSGGAAVPVPFRARRAVEVENPPPLGAGEDDR